ncbi:TIGR00266 family protein [Aestuariimicrobium soli]|uniref:TIGR00266 family protein n=1 Tax=Aestuariimicrobium soli TaxID=2035834 RepID=UPI003EBF6CA2
MQTQIRHQPSFAVARLHLAPGEPVRIESGSMMMHSAGLQISADTGGGLMAGLKRSVLSGESFFVTTATAGPQGGWVDVSAVLPGDLIALDLTPDRPYFVTRGCWLANSHGTEVTPKWGGMANLFGGEGGFGLHAAGHGQVVLSVYGALDVVDLQPGDTVVVDTGHVVAYDLGVRFELRRAVRGRTLQSMKSGEGFVFEFTGPGRLFLQSRNPDAFQGWVRQNAPSESASGGVLGGLFS